VAVLIYHNWTCSSPVRIYFH